MSRLRISYGFLLHEAWARLDGDEGIDLFAMNEALRKLSELDPQRAQLVEPRFFGGLTEHETAQVLGVSRSEVQRKWTLARAWLARRLRSES
ncbi:MAG: RNA polymerase sigma-70 factor (ECF subfamily) [Chlamydiales bacterium]